MGYLEVKEMAGKWGVSERMVRTYCNQGRVKNARFVDGNWFIPENAGKPKREVSNKTELKGLAKQVFYQYSKNNHYGVYEYIQINLAYSSCRMASNRMTREQVTDVYRTKKVSVSFEPMKIDDLVEIINHIACVRFMVECIGNPLTQVMIRKMHQLLCCGTEADRHGVVQCGEYRTGRGKLGVQPAKIRDEMNALISGYEGRKTVTLEDVLDFHVRFERIHPFDDYNGRVGRIIMMRECLRHNITPFIIDDKRRGEYNRGIAQWDTDPELIKKVVREGQARFANALDTCRLMEYHRSSR